MGPAEDLSTKTRALLKAAEGVAGEKGDTGRAAPRRLSRRSSARRS